MSCGAQVENHWINTPSSKVLIFDYPLIFENQFYRNLYFLPFAIFYYKDNEESNEYI